jgi:prevent-host-death family protein
MIKTSSTELKIHLGKFLDSIQSGEEVLVSRNGKCIALITPVNSSTLKKDALSRIKERSGKYALDIKNPKKALQKELKRKYD